MAEARSSAWRSVFIGLSAAAIVMGAAAAGAYANGVRLTRATETGGVPAVQGQPHPLLWQALSREQRGALRRALGQAWRSARQERIAAGQARLRVIGLAGQDAYDPAAMQEALAAMRAADAAAAAKIHDNLAVAMAALSPEERRALLAAAARFRGQRSAGQAADASPQQ
jgi:uncharacterized membrane protein